MRSVINLEPDCAWFVPQQQTQDDQIANHILPGSLDDLRWATRLDHKRAAMGKGRIKLNSDLFSALWRVNSNTRFMCFFLSRVYVCMLMGLGNSGITHCFARF